MRTEQLLDKMASGRRLPFLFKLNPRGHQYRVDETPWAYIYQKYGSNVPALAACAAVAMGP